MTHREAATQMLRGVMVSQTLKKIDFFLCRELCHPPKTATSSVQKDVHRRVLYIYSGLYKCCRERGRSGLGLSGVGGERCTSPVKSMDAGTVVPSLRGGCDQQRTRDAVCYRITSIIGALPIRSTIGTEPDGDRECGDRAPLRPDLRHIRSCKAPDGIPCHHILIGRACHVTVYRYRHTRDPRVCLYRGVPFQCPRVDKLCGEN